LTLRVARGRPSNVAADLGNGKKIQEGKFPDYTNSWKKVKRGEKNRNQEKKEQHWNRKNEKGRHDPLDCGLVRVRHPTYVIED